MRNGRSASLFSTCLAITTAVSRGQSPGATAPHFESPVASVETAQQDDSVSFKTQVDLVVVPVVVRDGKGNAIGSLRKEDFQLFDGKHRQEITTFRIQRASGSTA